MVVTAVVALVVVCLSWRTMVRDYAAIHMSHERAVRKGVALEVFAAESDECRDSPITLTGVLMHHRYEATC